MPNLIESAATWIESGAWIVLAGRLTTALLIVVASAVLAKGVTLALRRLRGRARTGKPLIYIVERLSVYAFVLAGLFVGISTLGVNLTSLAVFAGAVGVGVGLGLQGVVREFVSGLVVIFDPLVHVGDFVELENGVRGEVVEVGPRATRLRTNDGLNVVIPNSKLIESQVLNWTHKGGTRRIHVPFRVAHGADKALVRDVVLEAAKALPFTLPDEEGRKTQVWMTGFGDNAMDFELVVWPTFEAVRRPAAMRAAYTWAIDDALRAADLEIPYPQMDLRVRSLFGREGDPAFEALGLNGERAPRPAAEPHAQAAPNDAAEAVLDEAHREAHDRAKEEAAGGPPPPRT
jgi:small-conductance mechanosensitive channel